MTDHSQAMTAKYRQDYRAPLYWIDSIDLDFQLQEPLTRVTAISRLRRNGEHNEPLVLDGEGLVLHSVSVDGVPFTQFEQGESSLTLFNLPADFEAPDEYQIEAANITADLARLSKG